MASVGTFPADARLLTPLTTSAGSLTCAIRFSIGCPMIIPMIIQTILLDPAEAA
jgi:hypothetical protein